MIESEEGGGQEVNFVVFFIHYSSQGTVRSYDIRKKAAVHSFSTMGDVTAMSIHTMSDVVAW